MQSVENISEITSKNDNADTNNNMLNYAASYHVEATLNDQNIISSEIENPNNNYQNIPEYQEDPNLNYQNIPEHEDNPNNNYQNIPTEKVISQKNLFTGNIRAGKAKPPLSTSASMSSNYQKFGANLLNDMYEKYMAAGKKHMEKKKYKRALLDFSNAISIKENSLAYQKRSELHHRMGNKIEAVNDLKKALELDRNNVDIKNELDLLSAQPSPKSNKKLASEKSNENERVFYTPEIIRKNRNSVLFRSNPEISISSNNNRDSSKQEKYSKSLTKPSEIPSQKFDSTTHTILPYSTKTTSYPVKNNLLQVDDTNIKIQQLEETNEKLQQTIEKQQQQINILIQENQQLKKQLQHLSEQLEKQDSITSNLTP